MFGSGPQPPSPVSRTTYGLPTTPAGQLRGPPAPASGQGASAKRTARESGVTTAANVAARTSARAKRMAFVACCDADLLLRCDTSLSRRDLVRNALRDEGHRNRSAECGSLHQLPTDVVGDVTWLRM